MLCDQCGLYSWPTAQSNTLTNLPILGTAGIYALPQGTAELLGISIPQPETQTSYIDTQAKALGEA